MAYRLSPHVVVEGEPSASVVVDRRTRERHPISEQARALLDELLAAGAPREPADLQRMMAHAALERLGALVACDPPAALDPGESPWTAAAADWPGSLAETPDSDREPGAVIMGLPWDFGMGSEGAARGPDVIRSTAPVLRQTAGHREPWPGWYSYALGRDLLAGVPLRDAGDLNGPVIADYEIVEGLLLTALSGAPGLGPVAVFIGGDHGLTRSVLRALPRRPRTLVMLDAHDDFEPSSAPDHGSFVRVLIRERVVDHVRIVGVRGLAAARRGDELASAGIDVLTAAAAMRATSAEVDAWAASLPDAPVYLSIDIDVLDPSLAPGTRCLRAGGLSVDDAIRVVAAVARHRTIEALDLMEVAAPRGPLDLTPLVASELLLHAVGLAIESRQREPRAW